jgi:hypothetical protein
VLDPIRKFVFDEIDKQIRLNMHESLRPDVHFINQISRFIDNRGLNQLVEQGKVNIVKGRISRFT